MITITIEGKEFLAIIDILLSANSYIENSAKNTCVSFLNGNYTHDDTVKLATEATRKLLLIPKIIEQLTISPDQMITITINDEELLTFQELMNHALAWSEIHERYIEVAQIENQKDLVRKISAQLPKR